MAVKSYVKTHVNIDLAKIKVILKIIFLRLKFLRLKIYMLIENSFVELRKYKKITAAHAKISDDK